MRIFKSHPLLSLVNGYLVESPQGLNINGPLIFGRLLWLCLVISIIMDVVSAAHYNPSVSESINSVEHIMRDVNNGWLIFYLHSNFFSLLHFLAVLTLVSIMLFGIALTNVNFFDLISSKFLLTLIFGVSWHITLTFHDMSNNVNIVLLLPFIRISLAYLWINTWHFYLYNEFISIPNFLIFLTRFFIISLFLGGTSFIFLYQLDLMCGLGLFSMDAGILVCSVIDPENHNMTQYQLNEFVRGVRFVVFRAINSNTEMTFKTVAQVGMDDGSLHSTAAHHMSKIVTYYGFSVDSYAVGMNPVPPHNGVIAYPAYKKIFD